MLKLFQFWTRRPDLTRVDALTHLRDVHAPRLAAAAPAGVLRCATSVALPTDYSGWHADEAPAYDAVGELWCEAETAADLQRVAIDGGVVRTDDERAFIGTAQLMAAEQVVHVDRGRAHRGVKTMFLLTRRPELTRDEAMAYWHERHAPLVRDTLGDALVRYATNIGIESDLQGWPSESPPFDGVAELWLDLSMAEMREVVSAAADVLLPDERAFLGTYRWLATEEHVHLGDANGPLPAASAEVAR